MAASKGRDFSYSCLVVVGNRNGLAGYSVAKAKTGERAQKKAKNQAIRRLQYFKLYNNHTIFHKIYSRMVASHLFIEPRPEGHGVRSHRVIRTICEAIGIKDLWVKVEHSSHNTKNITVAFFRALRAQKDIQQLTDEMRLYCVEYRDECDNFPSLIATPRPEIGPVRCDAEIGTQEYRDMDLVLNDGKVTQFPLPVKPPYVKFGEQYLARSRWVEYKRRNQHEAAIRRQMLYSDEYPEPLVFYRDDFVKEQTEDEGWG